MQIRFAKGINRSIGLMFSKEKNFNYAYVFDIGFESRIFSSVHMFFVFFPILVLFLNKNKKIVDIVEAKPFGIYVPKKKARYFVEIPISCKGKYKIGEYFNF